MIVIEVPLLYRPVTGHLQYCFVVRAGTTPIANGVVKLLMLLKKLLQKNYRLLKSCLQQLYLNKMMTQLLHLVFVFTPAANLVTDEFSCQSDEFKSQSDEFNSIANGTNSFAKATKSIAKRTNSIAKTCN